MPDRRPPALRTLARGVGVGAVVGAVLGAAFMSVLAATALIGPGAGDHTRPETELIILAVAVAAAIGMATGTFVGAVTALAVLARSAGPSTASMRTTATLTCGVAAGAVVSLVLGVLQPEPAAFALISGGVLGVLSASIAWMVTPTLARP